MRLQRDQLEAVLKFTCEGSYVPFQNALIFDGQSLIASDGLSIVKVTDPLSEPVVMPFLIPREPLQLALDATSDREPIWINDGKIQFSKMTVNYQRMLGEIPDFKKILLDTPRVEGYPMKFFTIHPKRLTAALWVCNAFCLSGDIEVSHAADSEILFLTSKVRPIFKIEMVLMGNQLW